MTLPRALADQLGIVMDERKPKPASVSRETRTNRKTMMFHAKLNFQINRFK